MAKIKNKNVQSQKRQRNVAKTEDQQLKQIDRRFKKIERKDIAFFIVFFLFALFLIVAIVYAGVSIFS